MLVEQRVPKSRMLVLTIPLSAGFEAGAAAFDDAVHRHPGSAWLYGNVYDPSDDARR